MSDTRRSSRLRTTAETAADVSPAAAAEVAASSGGVWTGSDLSGQLCEICARGIELGAQCQTCQSTYHLACLSDTFRDVAEAEQNAWKQCPSCFLETAVTLCKCGSAKHRTPLHRDCPLNPRLNDAPSADASATSVGVPNPPPAPALTGWSWTRDEEVTTTTTATSQPLVEPEIMDALVRNYNTILAGAAEAGWTGPPVGALSADELLSFPLDSLLSHNRVMMQKPVMAAR